ncbi:hypothetical protein GCM10007392_22700 [Saccharospirillum salsuginis]|uniref:Uncharacterized protein n=1 Tax=Saccharospirillum salsuginis TaxID=418750 RepID=A0A918NAZ5_9GAMM|nr:hypothetical protein [Saccharospirillum salsuginis]GGX54710.1 hypothetical protein GCM10007392_22700 [Saccharospirillum salsuginis]
MPLTDTPKPVGVTDLFDYFRRAQQRLGGNAAPVQADAAQMFAFYQGGCHSQLGGANSRDVATGATANHDQIVCLHSALSAT